MLKEHICRLNILPVKIVNRVVETGILINLRRKCLSMIMMNEIHPRSSIYFKSNRAKRIEKRRHLLKYTCVIHPFSIFSLYWEFFMTIMYITTFIVSTITAVPWDRNVLHYFFYIKIYIDVVQTIDILKVFFTGFYDKELGKTILKPSSLAKKYLSTYFLVDLLNTGHLLMIVVTLATGRLFTASWGHVIRCLFYLRILRIRRWLDALEMFHLYANLSAFFNKALKAVFIIGLFWMWLYAVKFQFEISLSHWFDVKRIISGQSFFVATLELLHVSYGDIPQDHVHQLMESMFFMCLGYCLQLFLFSQIFEVCNAQLFKNVEHDEFILNFHSNNLDFLFSFSGMKIPRK
ncbi:hypothetical protein JTB14_033930 [Gonioctena quinquepunctata]|nr:hypothetical protein JTB14_033930 [Gonioctena quinquepunctata]